MPRQAAWKVASSEALQTLSAHKSSVFFMDPVIADMGSEDYPLVIPQPMYISMVQQKLESGKYKKICNLVED